MFFLFLETLPECTADALFTIANEPEFEPWSKPLHENKMYLSCDIKPTNNNNIIKNNEIKHSREFRYTQSFCYQS